MYEQRSKLGLVGSSYDVHGRTWVAKDSTIGPGTDSYYEYLLKVGGCSGGGCRADAGTHGLVPCFSRAAGLGHASLHITGWLTLCRAEVLKHHVCMRSAKAMGGGLVRHSSGLYGASACCIAAWRCWAPCTLTGADTAAAAAAPLQAYLMFGDPAHLDMFCELYASTMRYLQVRRGGGRVRGGSVVLGGSDAVAFSFICPGAGTSPCSCTLPADAKLAVHP